MNMVSDFEENHNKSIKNLNVFSSHTPVICMLLHLLYHTLDSWYLWVLQLWIQPTMDRNHLERKTMPALNMYTLFTSHYFLSHTVQ